MGTTGSPKSVVMHAQSPYILPLKGLKTGNHTFNLTADQAFFATFPDSPVKDAKLQLLLTVDKRHGDLVLDFDFSGTIRTECDRCLAEVDFPVNGQEQLMVQYTADEDANSDDPGLVLLPMEEHQLNVAPYAYEFFLLGLPMIRTFDCREGKPPYPCDEETLDRIEEISANGVAEAEKPKDQPSPWDALKDWKKN